MNTRFIETFVTLAQLRSFRGTAVTMHSTPAAISQRIKGLEEELNTELVDRSSREFKLTVAGEYLLNHCRAVLDAVKRLELAANQDNPVQGKLRLGVIETVVHSWLASFMSQLSDKFPGLEVDLSVDTSQNLQQRLIDKEIDLVIRVDGVDHPEVVSQPVALYPVRWIAKAGLITPRRNGLPVQVLQYPVLTFAKGTAPERSVREIVTSLAGRYGVPLDQTRITRLPSVAAMVQLLRDGFGVAAIPGLFVRNDLQNGILVELPLKPEPPAFVVAVCRRTEAALSVIAAADLARSVCHEYCLSMDSGYVKTLGEAS